MLTKTQKFIKDSNLIHNNIYNYDKTVYVKDGEHVIICCNVHGDFEQTPNKHKMRRGCYKCGRLSSAKKQTKTREQFIEDARKIYGDKYGYLDVVYVNCKTKVTITCETHGNFEQTPSNHLWGFECSKCASENMSSYFRDTTEEFIRKATLMHGDKFDYSESIYGSNAHDKVIIICKDHGKFEQKSCNHVNLRQGCPKCCKNQYSKIMNG